MHELSIAMGIVELAEKEAEKAGSNTIEAIELEIGTLSGVELEALEFAWPVAVKGTALEHAKKIVHQPQGKARCTRCGLEYPIENLFDSCPECNCYLKDILQGKELRIKSITIPD
jgi:hydrogenase nickel incorporation protein HypA/HybF